MKIRVGIVGYGYWGPKVARNFAESPLFELKRIADLSEERRSLAAQRLPGVEIIERPEAIISAADIDAVAIMTPVATHYGLAKDALTNGKHVLIGKPLTASVPQAKELQACAERNKKILMIDTTFLFTPAVSRIKQYVDSGELGEIYYIDSVRVNLGLFQSDVNVLWDLAPHDLSIIDYLLGAKPTAVSATGAAHFPTGLADIAYISLFYPENILAHIHVNWLSPIKIRRTLIGGSKKMLVWDDLDQESKIKVYDKGVALTSTEVKYRVLAEYRMGDMVAPALTSREALSSEIEYFAECIRTGNRPINDGQAGVTIVEILEAAQQSLADNGQKIVLQ